MNTIASLPGPDYHCSGLLSYIGMPWTDRCFARPQGTVKTEAAWRLAAFYSERSPQQAAHRALNTRLIYFERDLGTIHPHGSARTPSSSGRALPPCSTTPRTKAALRFKSSRKARIPLASLEVTWLPALISSATNLPASSRMKSTSCPARSRQ